MNEGDLLLRAICENPKEDDPRLRYADWLDEQSPTEVPCGGCNGKPRMYSFKPPTSTNWIQVWASTYECLACGGSGTTTEPDKAKRAEFIRVQVRLAKWRADAAEHSLSREGRRKHEELRDRQEASWQGLLPSFGLPNNWLVTFDPSMLVDMGDDPFVLITRGFVSHVTCTAADWLTHADSLAWVPGATKQCPECGGSGLSKAPPGDIARKWPCGACDMTGSVPREFKGTEQPIERVSWTNYTLTDEQMTAFGAAVKYEGGKPVWTFERWKGIKFTLPAFTIGVDVPTVGDIAAGAIAIMDPDGTVTATS